MHTSLSDPNIHYAKDWKDISSILHLEPKAIAFHINMVTQNGATVFEFMSMLETLIKFAVPDKSIYVGVCIDKDTPHGLIKDLRKTSVMGILPSEDFGADELDTAIEEMQKGHPYWPRHIIDQLPGAVIKVKHSTNEIRLTNKVDIKMSTESSGFNTVWNVCPRCSSHLYHQVICWTTRKVNFSIGTTSSLCFCE